MEPSEELRLRGLSTNSAQTLKNNKIKKATRSHGWPSLRTAAAATGGKPGDPTTRRERSRRRAGPLSAGSETLRPQGERSSTAAGQLAAALEGTASDPAN